MPTVSAGSAGSYTFTGTQTITITCDPAEVALWEVSRGGRVVASSRAGNDQVIGPFQAGDVLTITAARGAIDYTVNAYDGAYALSSAQVSSVQALVSGAGIPWAGHASAVGNAGAVQKFSDIGTGGSLFVSDGTYWRPLGGSVCLLNRVGSAASPVASITSVGAALLFGAPLAGIRIPAGLLIPGQSMIQIDGYWSKRGSTSGANCTTFLGTTNSLSDSQFSGQSIGAAATSVWRQRTEIFAHASTSFTNANHTVTVNGVAGAVTTSSPNVNINTAADMFINFGSTNAVSGDGHDILRMTISVFQ